MLLARYPTITMIVEMTMQILMTILFSNHQGKCSACSHQKSPSCQHFENEWWELYYLLCRRNSYILHVGMSIVSRTRRINASLRFWHSGKYPIKHVDDWICPLMYIFTRGRIQMMPVRNWLHGKLEICGDMRPLLTTWQVSLSVQITHRRPPFQAFWRWSWHVWSV